MKLSRKSFLGGAAVLTASASVSASALPVLAAPAAGAHAMGSAEALGMLRDGNRRYAAGKTIHGNLTARRDEVAPAQHPFAMILSCADSRVPPELIFDQSLGDLFVVRVAGNYAETGGIGSFEYAFAHFHSPLLVVLGHSSCGAVHATVDALKTPGEDAPGDIAAIVAAITPSVRVAQRHGYSASDLSAASILQNARDNAARLSSQRPLLSEGVAKGTLRVVSAVYDLKSGLVSF